MKFPIRANNQRNRYAPIALTRNKPVRTVRDHCADTVTATVWPEFSLINRFEGFIAQTVFAHRDKPLRRGAANNGGFGPPTMRIAQRHDTARQKITTLNKRFQDFAIGFPVLSAFLGGREADYVEALEALRHHIRITALIIQRHRNDGVNA